MDFVFLDIVLELIKILASPNLSQYVKEKSIKELVCRSADVQPDFGPHTKNALKTLINASPDEIVMVDSVLAYLSTQNCND